MPANFFKPMLAGTLPQSSTGYDVSTLRFPLIASPKLDGIRATIQNGKVYSRSLKLHPNKWAQAEFGKPEYEGLDGELIFGNPTAPDCFNVTGSIVGTINGVGWVDFYVFDKFDPTLPFDKRLEKAQEASKGVHIKTVLHKLIHNVEELYHFETTCLEMGFEGVMVRSIKSPYKQNRSTLNEGFLLKLKRFTDSEAVVLGFAEGLTNTNPATINERGNTARSSAIAGKIPNGTCGKLFVRDIKTGCEFKVGPPGTMKDLKEIWENQSKYLGMIVKYKFQAIGTMEKPRLPIAVGWRNKEDM